MANLTQVAGLVFDVNMHLFFNHLPPAVGLLMVLSTMPHAEDTLVNVKSGDSTVYALSDTAMGIQSAWFAIM